MLGVKLFNRSLLFVILEWYSIPVLSDMEDHIKKIRKTWHFHLLTNISKMRTYLDRESTEAIIHVFVTTNWEYCNAILYGLPKVLLNRPQLVQNRAPRIVTFTKKYEHITPSLIDLHWLPVKYRIIHRRTGRGGEGGCSPPKFWANQIFWAARENLGKAIF